MLDTLQEIRKFSAMTQFTTRRRPKLASTAVNDFIVHMTTVRHSHNLDIGLKTKTNDDVDIISRNQRFNDVTSQLVSNWYPT
jgi:hypothetical protein